jgi:hypothetical protein
MSISSFLAGMRTRGEMLKQAQNEDIVINKVQERKKSSNERVLEKLLERDRQEAIKKELERREKKEKDEYWKKDIITQKNLFTNSNGNSILKQGNLFGSR